MSDHTPGPWIKSKWVILDEANRTVICNVLPWDVSGCRNEDVANVCLIAAAPDLLEELEDRYHDTKCGCGHPACRRCQADARTLAVIQKAKRESDE